MPDMSLGAPLCSPVDGWLNGTPCFPAERLGRLSTLRLIDAHFTHLT